MYLHKQFILWCFASLVYSYWCMFVSGRLCFHTYELAYLFHAMFVPHVLSSLFLYVQSSERIPCYVQWIILLNTTRTRDMKGEEKVATFWYSTTSYIGTQLRHVITFISQHSTSSVQYGFIFFFTYGYIIHIIGTFHAASNLASDMYLDISII